jgi:translin
MLLKEDLERIQGYLEGYDSARERLLECSRKAVRLAAWAMLQVHRMRLEEAGEALREVEDSLREMEESVKGYPELSSHPNALTAYQEYAEARFLYILAREDRLCRLDEVRVPSAQYLLGLLDVIGELRRTVLEYLKRGDPGSAESKLDVMEGIYEDLLSLDFTAAIPNFRHKMDAARRIIEATRGDVITELRRKSLEEAINDLYRSMDRLRVKGGGVDEVLSREGQEGPADDG